MATYTTQNAPLPYVQPYHQDFLARSQEVANQPFQQSPGTYTGPNQFLQAGFDATANRAMQGSPLMSQANSQLSNIMGGGMMGGNPYLSESISNAQGDLTKAWNQVQKPAWDTAMQRSGSFGNTGVMQSNGFAADSLQQNLGRVASDMRGNAYNTERNFMQQALMAAPAFANQDYIDSQQLLNVGNQAQQFSQAAQNQNQQWFNEARQFPRDQLGVLGNALGMNQGSTQTQTAPDPSRTSQVVGGALTGASLAKIIADLWGE
jgi:hypothetical protein